MSPLLRILALASAFGLTLSGCFGDSDSPSGPASVQGGIIRPELGLGGYGISGTFHHGKDGKLRAQVSIVDSLYKAVLLRTGDRLLYRVAGNEVVGDTGTVDLPAVHPGDSVVLELVLSDSGSVFRAGLVAPSPLVFHPCVLPRDTLLEIGFDGIWHNVLAGYSLEVVGRNGAELRRSDNIWMQAPTADPILEGLAIGPLLFDLRTLVRGSASMGIPDSVLLNMRSGAGITSLEALRSRFHYSSVDWYEDGGGDWRIPLGL